MNKEKACYGGAEIGSLTRVCQKPARTSSEPSTPNLDEKVINATAQREKGGLRKSKTVEMRDDFKSRSNEQTKRLLI